MQRLAQFKQKSSEQKAPRFCMAAVKENLTIPFGQGLNIIPQQQYYIVPFECSRPKCLHKNWAKFETLLNPLIQTSIKNFLPPPLPMIRRTIGRSFFPPAGGVEKANETRGNHQSLFLNVTHIKAIKTTPSWLYYLGKTGQRILATFLHLQGSEESILMWPKGRVS